ncbi:MAG: hypothetical protein ACXWWD_02390, partial [Chitinophagaceae bacterium]
PATMEVADQKPIFFCSEFCVFMINIFAPGYTNTPLGEVFGFACENPCNLCPGNSSAYWRK